MSGVQAERITPRKKFIAQTIPILNGEKAEWNVYGYIEHLFFIF